MSSYTELTENFAEQWATAVKQLQDVHTAALSAWVPRVSNFVPDVDVPFADRLPNQKEVVEANFRFAERVLDAQRSYAVGLVEAATASQPANQSQGTQKKTSSKS